MATCRRARIRFANALRSLGVEHEQRVALLLNDTVDYPVAFWGVIRAGAIAIPLNTYLPLPQYAYILGDCRATTLVVATPLAQSISPIIDRAAAIEECRGCRRPADRSCTCTAKSRCMCSKT